MKKIFTLAAAVLASFSLWADDATFTMSTIFDGSGQTAEITEPVEATVSTTTSKSNAPAGKLGSDGNYFQIVLKSETFSAASINGYINTTTVEGKNWGFQFSTDGGATWSEEALQANDGNKTAHDIAVEATIPDGANGFRVVRHAGTSTIVASITLTLGGSVTPSTDPVKTVTLSGPEACYVGKVASYAATTDVKANAYKWTVNGAEQEGATAAKFDYTPATAGNYAIVCLAKNDNNTDYVASNTITLVATEKPAATPCAELYPAATGDTPAQGAKAALTDASYGGDIIFAGAKNNDFAAAFKYTEYGLQMCTGGADSVRVELGHNIAVGTVIELRISVAGMADGKTRGFNLLTVGGKSVLAATWTPVETEGDTVAYKVFTYEVTDKDGLAGQNAFRLQRSNSAILEAVLVSDCGEEITPDTDPVVEATVAGPTEAYVNQTVQLTCTAAKADKYQWYDANGAIEGATAAKYSFVPAAAGSYSFYCTATNEYTATPVQSNTLVITVTEKQTLAQVTVSESTIWDWTKAASVKEIKWDETTTPAKDIDTVLLANIDGMNNNADFNSQALLFAGQYPVRDSKYCQGPYISFKTTVAGYVQVDFSNTGTKDDPRYVAVNGVVNTDNEGSLNTETKTSARIAVPAGDVVITGAFADGTTQYLRIYKIAFMTGEIPTAINNVEESVKAVKVIRDGKLFIEKNGVLYNAQGVVVK